ncbi:MAG TPA: DUF885 domain-containing protein [Thermoanaerobaculia bacterium]|nr:DUF885 domain-containing protein [Thermoanaerobaculia bacterium]
MERIFTLLILALPLLGAAPVPASRSSQALTALLADFDAFQLDEEPAVRIQRGLDVTKLPDESYEGFQKVATTLRGLRKRLAAIDPKGLDPQERLSREVLDWELANDAAGAESFWDFFQVTPYASSFRSLQEVFTSVKLRDPKDQRRYLDLLRQYARVIDQLRTNLEMQRTRGILLPKAEIDAAVGLVRSFLHKPEESSFAVSSDRLEKFAPEGAKAFQAEVLKLIGASVNPALEALAALPDSKAYRDAAPEAVGLVHYPGGQKAYAYVVALHTTLDAQDPKAAPMAIHQRGLAEVARLNARLDAVRQQVKFAGDLAAFRRFLKTDPRFYVKTPAEVAERLLAPVRRIEPRVKDYFLRVPKAPYGVARLEPELEGGMTYGYYRPPIPGRPEGDYMFNGSQLDERSMLSAASLIYHELVPGHHFQLALQQEATSLPEFRRNSYPTAFVEGWAVYASELAEEMGGYADPYDLCGMLAQNLFLASRLVVDTGMNALGWTRQQAIDYMRENTLESDTQIGTETLRYAVDIPGQALAYKMGSSTIWELRRHAEKELGAKFDLRRFHDAVLGNGALPMTVLSRQIETWIDQERRR